jgi:hypothetical protein
VLGLLGFSGVLGWNPLASAFHLSVGLLYLCTILLLNDALSVRRIIGGLGVLLVATKVVTIASPTLLGDEPLHGPIEITCLVLGFTSILAARFLPNGA